MVAEILQKLEVYSDSEFKFDPIKHKYHYQGQHFISVTQFISRFHKEFDTEFWSKKKAEDRGVDQTEVLNEWKKLNDRANEIGTATHNWIENYFNRIYQELPSDLDVIDRINKFNVVFAKHLHKLTPVKFEQRIFSKKWKIAGMIDSLFLFKDSVIIFDWKTNKKFSTDQDRIFEYLLEPFGDLPKNHFNEYSIQVSLYRLILREIGIDVKNCYLLHIGPNDDAKLYKALDLTEKLEQYLVTMK
jgi:ATP-dependent exoDNAse (exonuclease V) beta subunit